MRLIRYPVKRVSADEEARLLGDAKAVFLTVTPVERQAFLAVLRPLPNCRAIVEVLRGPQTYFVGVFGKYVVAYTHSSMGSAQRDSSSNVTNDIIRDIRPAAIVMTGIAFGLRREHKQLGDVLVSEKITPYEVAKLAESATQYRGDSIRSGTVLLDRFGQVLDWNFRISRSVSAKAHVGEVLSGEKLVNKKRFVKKLEKDFPKAVGGEMEGTGVASACDRHRTEWIIVKGICDWGYDKKDGVQALAAKSSTSYALHVFGRERALDELPGKSSSSLNKDAVTYNARRGSPFWILNRLRETFLSAFLRDLKTFRLEGLPDVVNDRVKSELYYICSKLGEIPNHLFRGVSVQERMRQFVLCFETWAAIRGQGAAAGRQRDYALGRLAIAKNRLSRTVQRSSYLLGVGLEKGDIQPVVDHLSSFFGQYDDLFREFGRTRKTFRSER